MLFGLFFDIDTTIGSSLCELPANRFYQRSVDANKFVLLFFMRCSIRFGWRGLREAHLDFNWMSCVGLVEDAAVPSSLLELAQ